MGKPRMPIVPLLGISRNGSMRSAYKDAYTHRHVLAWSSYAQQYRTCFRSADWERCKRSGYIYQYNGQVSPHPHSNRHDLHQICANHVPPEHLRLDRLKRRSNTNFLLTHKCRISLCRRDPCHITEWDILEVLKSPSMLTTHTNPNYYSATCPQTPITCGPIPEAAS